MKTFVFDIEADSQYVRQVTTVHCLVVMDADTEEMWSYGPSEIEQGIAKLQEAERIVAHNGIQYDTAVLRRLYGTPLPPCLDTLIVSRILYPDFKKHPFGGNSIEDWGRKLGNPKIKYEGGWDTFTQEMLRYCQQDVRVGLAVYRELKPQFKTLAFPLKLEHQVTTAIQRQEETGVRFDMKRASVLEQQLLTDLAQLEDDLQEVFPPKAVQLKTKVKYVPFNPGSRQQCAERLIEKYGWKPKVLTDGGKPKFDEKIVAKLDYPEAELMVQYLMQGKRLSMLTSLVNAVQEDGRIHGSVNPMGCVTSRMSHNSPNVNLPKVKHSKDGEILYGMAGRYGFEFRSLFVASPGKVMVGADLAGLELRMLANRMWRWDNGEYARVILEGDVHSENMKAAGLDCRDKAKTFIYAFLYGAGNAKIGKIVGGTAKDGADLRAKFLAGLPALDSLLKYVKWRTKKYGTIALLDGRLAPVRSDHMALNTQLQGDGAIVAKVAYALACRKLEAQPFQTDLLLNVHDEYQTECAPEHAETVGKILVAGMAQAGRVLRVKLPIAGEYRIGQSWAETH